MSVRIPCLTQAGVGFCSSSSSSNLVSTLPQLPCIGIGTYRLRVDEKRPRPPSPSSSSPSSSFLPSDSECHTVDDNACYHAVRLALKYGFRLIDTGASYCNESSVGRAIQDSKVPREELFIIVKVGPKSMKSEAKVESSVRNSLRDLQLSYCDCILIHWPGEGGTALNLTEKHHAARQRTWRALKRLRDEEKLTRFIGVSNFLPRHMESMSSQGIHDMNGGGGGGGGESDIFLNQIELHPLCTQSDVVEYCRGTQKGSNPGGGRNIFVQQYAPLGECNAQLISHPTLQGMVDNEFQGGFTVYDILLLWGLVQGFSVLVKCASEEHIARNWVIAQLYAEWSSCCSESNNNNSKKQETMNVDSIEGTSTDKDKKTIILSEEDLDGKGGEENVGISSRILPKLTRDHIEALRTLHVRMRGGKERKVESQKEIDEKKGNVVVGDDDVDENLESDVHFCWYSDTVG